MMSEKEIKAFIREDIARVIDNFWETRIKPIHIEYKVWRDWHVGEHKKFDKRLDKLEEDLKKLKAAVSAPVLY